MDNFFRHPFFIFALSFSAMWISSWIGIHLRKKQVNLADDERQDLDLIVAATLTLLGLIIGFSFSMATNRYDLRKNYEEAEANAIGTEYLRADYLPAPDGARVRELLRGYLEQRIEFYQTRDYQLLKQIDASTAQLQHDLWAAIKPGPTAQQTQILALVISGMNEVLNSQGYSQAAWWNRIPVGAWGLMVLVAVCSNFLVGYGARRAGKGEMWRLILPLVLAVSFFLIADIDSPRKGAIRVSPQNLIALARSLHQL
jgi:hypothetical protein